MPGQPAIGTPTTAIGIDCKDLTVLDPGLDATSIIEASSNFQLQVTVELAGLFAGWLVSLPLKFTVYYYVESFGDGYEGEVARKDVTTVSGQVSYKDETRATVTAGTLSTGTYKLTALVKFAGAPPVPMTAFCEGGLIEIF